MTNMIEVRDVTRTYGSGSTAVQALRGVAFTLGEGHLVALRGRLRARRGRSYGACPPLEGLPRGCP
ncbi:MAG: hypothetical protein ACRDOD_14855 [Streptosporangiaceae bacterium]